MSIFGRIKDSIFGKKDEAGQGRSPKQLEDIYC